MHLLHKNEHYFVNKPKLGQQQQQLGHIRIKTSRRRNCILDVGSSTIIHHYSLSSTLYQTTMSSPHQPYAVFQLAPQDPGKQDKPGGAKIEAPKAWRPRRGRRRESRPWCRTTKATTGWGIKISHNASRCTASGQLNSCRGYLLQGKST